MKRDLGALAGREHDLLIIGGGIYGAAAAWEAAHRGLSVALVEARDFGSGTSWNSLKTIHGGLRHLQRADIPSLRESVRERRALLRIAPDLVRPLPFLIPTYGHGAKGREALGVGLLLNDLLSAGRNRGLPAEQRIPRGRILSRGEVLERVPGLPEAGLNGGALWTDAEVESSERLLLAFLHSAASEGARLANRMEVIGFLHSHGRVNGVRARDGEAGDVMEVRARMVLNAAGPAHDHLLELAGIRRPRTPLLAAFNLVLSRPIVTGQAVGAKAAGRFLFAVPWRDRSMIGTAYEPPEACVDGPRRFLEDARRAFPWASLTPQDVAVVHEGRVPGESAERLWTRNRLTDHAAQDGAPGLISVLGVKYTTARGAAERAIDLVSATLRRSVAPSRSATTLLQGTHIPAGTIEARVRHAVREEMALHLDDVVLRRLDLGTAARPEPSDLEAVCRALRTELAWSEEREREERVGLEARYPPAGVPIGA